MWTLFVLFMTIKDGPKRPSYEEPAEMFRPGYVPYEKTPEGIARAAEEKADNEAEKRQLALFSELTESDNSIIIVATSGQATTAPQPRVLTRQPNYNQIKSRLGEPLKTYHVDDLLEAEWKYVSAQFYWPDHGQVGKLHGLGNGACWVFPTAKEYWVPGLTEGDGSYRFMGGNPWYRRDPSISHR